MKILIGYSQRSGSTLLQHILGQHSQIHSYSDGTSLIILPALLAGYEPKEYNVCIKPMDFFFFLRSRKFYQKFDKFIWIARDPRDSYLSAFEVGYAYFGWLPGRKLHGIDIGLLKRWKLIYRQFFNNRQRWYMIRYEDLVTNPRPILGELFNYLEVPYEDVYPFKRFKWLRAGGDPKLEKTTTVHNKSIQRHKKQMPPLQQRIFRLFLGKEMRNLGYL
ncbi:MAG: sulfotransferase [Anaerolineales bacterium]|nr:sulfotransferase [Anaerolineales bacterium]